MNTNEAFTVEALFGPQGRLAQILPGFEYRAGQQRLAEAVQEAMRRQASLVAEAGTGVGKSLAYLLPAALGRRPVIVSTATKALQEQLLYQDVPLVAQALQRPMQAAPLKGRANYACALEHERAVQRLAADTRELFETLEERETWTHLTAWIEVQQAEAVMATSISSRGG